MINLIAQVSKALKRQPKMLSVSLIHSNHGVSSLNIDYFSCHYNENQYHRNDLLNDFLA